MTSLTHKFSYIEQRGQYIQEAEQLFDGVLGMMRSMPESIEAHILTELERARKALKDSELKIVVIGEFSRGKSTLLNALLGIKILPTALQQTTAINTFIRASQGEPYVMIHFMAKDAPKQLPFSEDALVKWGTELDSENRDARGMVDYIEIFSDHPLLKNRLILIDTPGFEGVLPHHEEIAKRAINEAHVAIWLQSAQQLGGNAREWARLTESINQNFQKFITVINYWDLILEPDNAHERQRPLAERERVAYDAVRRNFVQQAHGSIGQEQINILTDVAKHNLIGISASWACDDDQDKRIRSNIHKLVERLEKMCREGEAEGALLAKPVRVLCNALVKLVENLEGALETLEHAKNLEALKLRTEALHYEIKTLEQEGKLQVNEARQEHRVIAARFTQDAKTKLVQPLDELLNHIDHVLTIDYVRAELQRGAQVLKLPEDLQHQYDKLIHQVNRTWGSQIQELEKKLSELRAGFEEKLSHVTGRMEEQLKGIEIKMPPLEVHKSVDLSAYKQHQHQALKLQEELERNAEEHARTQAAHKLDVCEAELRKKRLEEERASIEARQRQLGAEPPPHVYQETTYKKEESSMWLGSPKPVPVTTTKSDTSARDDYRAEFARLEAQREERLKEIEAAALREERAQINREEAEARFERELRKKQRELQSAAAAAAQDLEQNTNAAYAQLRRESRDKLTRIKDDLDDKFIPSINNLFEHQLRELERVITEQIQEPLEVKHAEFEETQRVIAQGEGEVLRRKEMLQSRLAQASQFLNHCRALQAVIEAK